MANTALQLNRADEALDAAETGLDHLPDDPITIQAAVKARALCGDVDGAALLLASRSDVLPAEQQVRLERWLESVEDGTDEPSQLPADRFAAHADFAVRRAAALVDAAREDEAETMLRHALELDPTSVKAAAELGHLLSQTGREDEALAWYDECLASMDTGELLRFNRGNCLLRLDRAAEAVADYERCLELAPAWRDPRVNAVSAYCLLGDIDTARSHLSVLSEDPGMDPDMLDELREQIDATDP